MEKFKNKYRTESTRLQYWDYSSPGYYFITICTKNRINYFGEIENGRMNRNKIGDFAQKFWLEIPNHFFNVTLNEFIIMPNHIHGIVVINNNKTLVETRHCLVSTNVNNNTTTTTTTTTTTPPTTTLQIPPYVYIRPPQMEPTLAKTDFKIRAKKQFHQLLVHTNQSAQKQLIKIKIIFILHGNHVFMNTLFVTKNH